MRNVGPAFTSGRIADIAIHPEDESTWYVAVGSGGVWKTTNNGVTWNPIFDDYDSYSTGAITIDPNDPSRIWLGTGENVGGRHVGYGDGVYLSTDDGESWKNMGLDSTEHIGRILVHPHNSDIVWVAAEGPLWRSGDQRGLYKTVDGGESWKKVLGNDEWTGASVVVLDPRDPDVLYATTWDRHRTVAAYMGGGPGSGIHKSTDGGETWTELTQGLPKSNLGKIGLAISPQNPDVLYAAIELDRTNGAVYRSSDRGSSWTKMSNTVSGGTGPHYYQELWPSPHQFDRIYLMDVRIQMSEDGGRTFRRVATSGTHSDNHAIAFKPSDPDYVLIGTDGGLYESFDGMETFRFIDNMPITQYYKVAVNDAKPFYHIFGGTQDNGSHGGPSQTDNRHGIRNADWYKTLGADGHQSATEPGNPNIVYAEGQQGWLHRIDLATGDQVFVQPQPREGEDFERYNWDAPILVSPHDPARIYFASQRVWRSDNRGDSWTPISEDLTRDEERLALPIMGSVQSWDNAWDVNAMSNYNTITSLAESPLQEGLLYAGTDDGLIQVSEDGGTSWRQIEVSSIPGVPERAFVNDIRADLHDANTVYLAMDNHKEGDFTPYLFKSTDRGNSWTSIVGNIPDRTLIWRTVQDHVKPELLFTATEYGIYFTLDGGEKWMKVAGTPTIAFRDLTIQRQENDLVAASFGRSFWILDDYTPLREASEEKLSEEAVLFQPADADWYVPRSIVSSQGDDKYAAENPPFGAVFTYYLAEGMESLKAQRKEKEKEAADAGEELSFPGWDVLAAEMQEIPPKVILMVKDADGQVVRRLEGPTGKGMHRVAWDLRYASKRPIDLGEDSNWDRGLMANPGTYSVSLHKLENGVMEQLTDPLNFEVVPMRQGTLEGASPNAIAAFRKDLETLQAEVAAADYMLENSRDKLTAMMTAMARSDNESPELVSELYELRRELLELEEMMEGNPAKNEIGERSPPTVQGRMYDAMEGLSTTYGPTEMHKQLLEIARAELNDLLPHLKEVGKKLTELQKKLESAGAPFIEGMAAPQGGR